jgi:hypothetical protein
MSSESESIESEASNASQYGEEFAPSEQLEREEITVTELPEWTRVDLDIPDVDDETTRRDFSSLTERERYLPLSHVLSPTDQWRAIYTALESNFRRTDGLPKVSDNALASVADATVYSIESGNTVPNAAYALLAYASKRNV